VAVGGGGAEYRFSHVVGIVQSSGDTKIPNLCTTPRAHVGIRGVCRAPLNENHRLPSSYLDHIFLCEKNVLGLQVAMQNVVFVKMLKRHSNLNQPFQYLRLLQKGPLLFNKPKITSKKNPFSKKEEKGACRTHTLVPQRGIVTSSGLLGVHVATIAISHGNIHVPTICKVLLVGYNIWVLLLAHFFEQLGL
jgi:hypothetical protein